MLGFAAGVAFLLVFNLGAAAPFAGLTLGGAVVAILDAPRLWRQAKGGYATLTRARRYCGYGAPLAVALAVELVVQAAARLILAEQAGAASLGAYAAAFALAQPLDFIFIGLSAAFAPVIFAAYESKSVDEVRQVAGAAFTALIAAALPTCVGLILVSEPLAALIIGEELRVEAGMVLPWLAIGGLFSGFTLYYWSEAFQLTRRNGLRAGLMLAPGAVQLAMTFVLARPYGAIGAAYAAACGALVGCVILAMVGRRLLTLPVSGAPLARALAATALMAAGLAMLTPPTGAIALTLYVGAGAAIYALGAVVFDVPGARARAATLTRAIARSVQPAAPAAPP
jgi:O-antigen/teichoic acid export membrane protein